MNPAKWFVRSKTLWVNLLIGAAFAAGLPVPDGATSADALQFVGVAAPVGNGLVRFATRQGLGSYGKRALRSKTVWLNVALLIGAGAAIAAGSAPVAGVLIGVAVVNLWLRGITDTPVTIAPHPLRDRRLGAGRP